MNKLFTKIAAFSVGLVMAIGVGVAVGSRDSGVREARALDVTVSESFDTFTAQTSYTGTNSYKNASTNLEWEIYLGNPTTTQARSGNSVLMRVAKGTSNQPYLQTKTPYSNVSTVTYYTKHNNGSNLRMSFQYSSNGTTWTDISTDQSSPSSYEQKTGTVPEAAKTSALYFRWLCNTTEYTPPTGSGKKAADILIDDVVITYSSGKSQEEIDQESADIVIALINSIGNVTSHEQVPAIVSARIAYDALNSNAKSKVSNYSTLTNAETAASGLLYYAVASEATSSTALTLAALQETLAFNNGAEVEWTAIDGITYGTAVTAVTVGKSDSTKGTITVSMKSTSEKEISKIVVAAKGGSTTKTNSFQFNDEDSIEVSSNGFDYYECEFETTVTSVDIKNVDASVIIKEVYIYFEIPAADALSEAKTWISTYFDDVTCDNGTTAPSKSNWTTASIQFGVLSASAKAILHDATYQKSGSGTSTVITPGVGVDGDVALAMSRYDWIIHVYGTSNYSNFIERSNEIINGRAVMPSIITNLSNDTTVIIVVSLLVSVVSIGAYFFLRKRKEI